MSKRSYFFINHVIVLRFNHLFYFYGYAWKKIIKSCRRDKKNGFFFKVEISLNIN